VTIPPGTPHRIGFGKDVDEAEKKSRKFPSTTVRRPPLSTGDYRDCPQFRLNFDFDLSLAFSPTV
jgi:hypothetical protein